MEVVLLGSINDVERIIAASSKSTKSISTADEIFKKIDLEEARKHIGKTMSRGHEGISEFSFYVFSVKGVSRVLTHQLVRHRIASYLQMSSRDLDLSETTFLVPQTIQKDPQLEKEFKQFVTQSISNYQYMISKKIPVEDARYLLPDAMTTHVVIGMNARSLNHFFGLRLCESAQWEIRELAQKMHDIVKKDAPSLFWSEPRPCVIRGFCPESDKKKETCSFYKDGKLQIEHEKYIKGYPNE